MTNLSKDAITTNLFETHTLDQQRKAFGDFLPRGKSFASKNIIGAQLFDLITGLCVEATRIEALMNNISTQQNIDQSDQLIDKWEEAVGIPDECFTNTVDLEQRQTQVKVKLAFEIDTRESLIELAEIFGYKCQITSGNVIGVYPLPYPWMYFASVINARFTLVIQFEESKAPDIYPFVNNYPWLYTSTVTSMMECIFAKVTNAALGLIFLYNL